MMEKGLEFRRVYDVDSEETFSITRQAISDLSARVEAHAISVFGPYETHDNRLFKPPLKPVRVRCSHCDAEYSSSEVKLEYRPLAQHHMVQALLDDGANGLRPAWWCPDIHCDGAGFGFDIHPIKKPRHK